MTLTAENVKSVLMYALFKDGEDTSTAIIAEGCKYKIGFHPQRLKEKESEIFDMLTQLPMEFQQSGGGGYTFLNACMTKEGNQWADLHQTIDELLTLGIATGKARMVMPREMWNLFPGGMPYFVVMARDQKVEN